MKCRYFAIIIILTLFWTCKEFGNHKKIQKDFREVEYSASRINFDSIYNIILDCNAVFDEINKVNHNFNKDILLNKDNVDLFVNSKEIAIALGMYTGDLCYAKHLEKVQQCVDYLEIVRTLSGKLELKSKDFNELILKIEQNINNRELLFDAIDGLTSECSVTFSINEQSGISLLFLSGFWIETIYLRLSSCADIIGEANVLTSYLNILEKINEFLTLIDDSAMISELKSEFSEIFRLGHENENFYNDIEKLRNKYVKSKYD